MSNAQRLVAVLASVTLALGLAGVAAGPSNASRVPATVSVSEGSTADSVARGALTPKSLVRAWAPTSSSIAKMMAARPLTDRYWNAVSDLMCYGRRNAAGTLVFATLPKIRYGSGPNYAVRIVQSLLTKRATPGSGYLAVTGRYVSSNVKAMKVWQSKPHSAFETFYKQYDSSRDGVVRTRSWFLLRGVFCSLLDGPTDANGVAWRQTGLAWRAG